MMDYFKTLTKQDDSTSSYLHFIFFLENLLNENAFYMTLDFFLTSCFDMKCVKTWNLSYLRGYQ